MKYDLAIFDMDGTLIDSMWIWKELAVRSFTSRGMKSPDNLEHKLFSMTFLDAAEFCIKESGADITKEELLEEWTCEASIMYEKDITLKPFTKEFLIYLKSLGFTLCINTANFREVAEMVLERFSLSQFFDSITVTEEVNASKSFPDVFLLSAAKHNVKPERCIVFEDSYFAVQGAKAAGMSVIGVYDEYAKHIENEMRNLADAYIYSFEELNNSSRFVEFTKNSKTD